MLLVVVWLLLIGSNCILSHLYLFIFLSNYYILLWVEVKLVIINCLYPLIMIYMDSIALRKFLMNYL